MQPLKLYNTRTKQKEIFEPLQKGHVGLYVCGPTVYDAAHVGNARPVVVFDVLYRLLLTLYPAVTYVRNITDVDDKIMKAAIANGESITALTHRTTKQYQEDMAAIGALSPTLEPRATHHISHMIRLIETLISRGHAYEAEGHVLFDVATYQSYGALSRRHLDEMIAGARVEVAPYKKQPHDFVLWKPSLSHEVGWESPWGYGRPGWHIECSAMAMEYLGAPFDIHGGGIDLVFPHHENERAQSACASPGDMEFANFWMHNGHLIVNGEKMSKSLGNFFTVHDKLKELPGEVIRLVLLSSHYRQPLDWTDHVVDQAKQTLDRFYGALRDYSFDDEVAGIPHPEIVDALKDDLNIPEAMRILHKIASDIYREEEGALKLALQKNLLASGRLMGFLFEKPENWFRFVPTKDSAGRIAEEEIESLIQKRLDARAGRDFHEADRIRDLLKEAGVQLEDGKSGTSWRRL